MFLNLEYGVFKLMTVRYQPQTRVLYILTLENGKSRGGVELALIKEIVMTKRCLVKLPEVPEDRW